ncbi:MAG: DUF2894 domain-containing protein [Candidatus Pelagadaptatus aseana]|uniref:DUF2894 domain-containing protein n=1 Tax=Candidatus Pelagadaptatus aseana TaxID=3120508 RepID=UPI0039B2D753
MTDNRDSVDRDLANLLEVAIRDLASDNAQQLLERLRERCFDQFDPVRFGFIESLVAKLNGQREAVSLVLIQKLKKALTELRDDFLNSQSEAQANLKVVADEFPDSLPLARQYFDHCEFKRLQKLMNGLYQKQLESPSVFKSLIEDLSRLNAMEEAHGVEASVSPTDVAQPDLAPVSDKPESTPRELKALTPLRESWAKLNAEKLVMRSINEGPENAGPLNPHYLAIRSLSNMRDLSPHYLNRFVAYMETLLWLEKARPQKSAKAKKSARNSRSTQK